MRSGAGLVIALVVAATAVACVAQDRSYVRARPSETSGAWRVEHRVDRITARPAPIASVVAMVTNSKNAAIHPATLELTCFESRPIVRLAYDLRVGADRSSTLAYRVDDRPGGEIEATFLPDQRTVVIDEPTAVTRFVADLSAGTLLLLRAASLFAGNTVAEFRIAGAATAIAPVLEACPLPAATAAGRSAAAR
jgi:hypothetical protein